MTELEQVFTENIGKQVQQLLNDKVDKFTWFYSQKEDCFYTFFYINYMKIKIKVDSFYKNAYICFIVNNAIIYQYKDIELLRKIEANIKKMTVLDIYNFLKEL